jgi:hypothetical protein
MVYWKFAKNLLIYLLAGIITFFYFKPLELLRGVKPGFTLEYIGLVALMLSIFEVTAIGIRFVTNLSVNLYRKIAKRDHVTKNK